MIQQCCGKSLSQTPKEARAAFFLFSSPPPWKCCEFRRRYSVCYLGDAERTRRPVIQSILTFSNVRGTCYGWLQKCQISSCQHITQSEKLCKVAAARQRRQQWRRPTSLSASSSTSVSWSLRSCPSQTEECINCSAKFPSVFADDFPRGLSEACFFFFLFFFFPPSLFSLSFFCLF